MAEGVLFSIAGEIIKKLGPLAAQEVALWCGVKDQLSKLEKTITRIKAVIQDAEEQALKQNHQIKNWLRELREAVNDAEDLLDDFSTQILRKQLMSGNSVSREVRVFFSRSNQFVYGLGMGHKIKALGERLDDIEADSKKFNFRVHDEERVSLTTDREQTTSSEPEVIVGREGDKVVVKSFLLNSNKENVSVISIVGMGGLGKTTLAQHVFNDDQVKLHFDTKLWVSVSGSLDVNKILKISLKAVGVGEDSDNRESLKKKLAEKIEKKKYLLVLDDLWDGLDGQDGEKWDHLKDSLPHDAVGSKIMVTTRSHVIANFTCTIKPHDLRGLSVDESWELFRKKAFRQGQESDHVDEKIKKEIVGRCCGVPLVIKAIARLMSLKDRDQWLFFITNELPDRIRDDNIIQTLKLSYDSLPSYMKHCFAYCSLFPKGHEIDVKSLILLWTAQGFVSSSNSGGGSLETAALVCFENLLWRSFFHEVEKDGLGNIKSCKMHDFMHDLATHVAGFESTKVESGENRTGDLARHVSVNMVLDLSPQIPIPLPCARHLRTLILWKHVILDKGAWESICQDFRRLRVLVLCPFRNEKVSPFIEKLKHLRYLNLWYSDEMEALPNCISNLVNLQVLKLNGCKKLKILPRDINKLINLRHLDVGCSVDRDLCDRLEYMPRGIGQLTCLQTLSCFVVGENSNRSKMVGGLDELSRLNELRGSLEIIIKGYERNSCILEFEGVKLINKQYLQSLTIEWQNTKLYLDSLTIQLQEIWGEDTDIDLYDKMLQSLHPNLNLQRLIVLGFEGMRFPSWLSHLLNLQKLSIRRCPRLKSLPLPDQGMDSLQKLIIRDCIELKCLSESEFQGIPHLPFLQELEITNCSEELAGRFREGEESVEWSNIKHIPTIAVDGHYIQIDGRYVNDERLIRFMDLDDL